MRPLIGYPSHGASAAGNIESFPRSSAQGILGCLCMSSMVEPSGATPVAVHIVSFCGHIVLEGFVGDQWDDGPTVTRLSRGRRPPLEMGWPSSSLASMRVSLHSLLARAVINCRAIIVLWTRSS